MVVAMSSLANYLATCHGYQDTFVFETELKAAAFFAKLADQCTDSDGRTIVISEQRGTKVVAWLATRPKD